VTDSVFLIGMPGSGKTSVGRELAGELGLPFFDLDAEVEAAAGRPVEAIFTDAGEAGFRELEAAALGRVIRAGPAVLACGGGTILAPANRELLKAHGAVVFLSVPLAVLRSRVRPYAGRPLLRSDADLRKLLEERAPIYRKVARWEVDASGPPAAVAGAVRELLG
jgi:shikimate kinase